MTYPIVPLPSIFPNFLQNVGKNMFRQDTYSQGQIKQKKKKKRNSESDRDHSSQMKIISLTKYHVSNAMV